MLLLLPGAFRTLRYVSCPWNSVELYYWNTLMTLLDNHRRRQYIWLCGFQAVRSCYQLSLQSHSQINSFDRILSIEVSCSVNFSHYHWLMHCCTEDVRTYEKLRSASQESIYMVAPRVRKPTVWSRRIFALRSYLLPPNNSVPLWRRRRVDGPNLLLWRHNAVSRPLVIFPIRLDSYTQLVCVWNTLLSYPGALAQVTRQKRERYIWFLSVQSICQPRSLIWTFYFTAGLQELKSDALTKGNKEEDGTKAFYRYSLVLLSLYHELIDFRRFRVFYMACSELFDMNGGQE